MRAQLITAFWIAANANSVWASEKEEGESEEADTPGEGDEGSAPPPAPPTHSGPPIYPLDAYFGEGFNLASNDGQFWLNIGVEARVQLTVFDSTSIDEIRAPPPTRLTVAPRSLHLFFRGRIFSNLEFGLGLGLAGEPDRDFDLGQVTIAYAAYYPFEWLQIQMGELIVPFGLEMSSYFYPTATIERSIVAENLAPYRDVGLIIQGRVLKTLWYHLGAISGTPPNINAGAQAGTFTLFRTDEQVDGIARLSFSLNDVVDGPFRGFGMGVSAQVGIQPFALGGLKTLFLSRSQPATLFDAPTRGFRWRVGGDLQYSVGPFTLRAEGLFERVERKQIFNTLGVIDEEGTESGGDVMRFGTYAEVGVFVYGNREEGGVEAVGKYEFFGAESESTPFPLNPIRLHMVTGGFNYYFLSNARVQLDGIFIDLRRYPTIEDPDPAPVSYLDSRRSWMVLAQFQVWFL